MGSTYNLSTQEVETEGSNLGYIVSLGCMRSYLNNCYTQNNLDEMDKVHEGHKLPQPTKEGSVTGEVLGLFKRLNSYLLLYSPQYLRKK